MSMYNVARLRLGLNIVHDLLRKADSLIKKVSVVRTVGGVTSSEYKQILHVGEFTRKSKCIKLTNQNTLFFVYHMR